MNKKSKKYHTDFLFPHSSFSVGFGSIFNVPGNYFDFNYSKSGKEADTKALKTDWGMIKQDFHNVVAWGKIRNMGDTKIHD